jgi:HK97 family phage major capsid protein
VFEDPDELQEELEAIRAELTELEAVEEPTEEQVSRAEELLGQWDTTHERYEKAEARRTKVEAIRAASLKPVNRTPGSAPDSLGGKRTREIYDIDAIRNNPWALGQGSVQAELVTRAYDAIEDLPARVSDDVREAATRTLENCQGQAQAAVHILTTGNPAYRSAFRKILRDPAALGWLEGEERAAARASMSLTSANGGYLLPFELDSTIILTNAGTTNQIRQIARQVQTSQNVYHLVSSAGVNMEWTAEAAEATDASPTFSQPTVTCYKGDVYVQASFEFLEDSNIESDLGMLIADAKARGEATAFTNGNGTTQPKGIITILQATTASRVSATTNGSFGVPDVFALDNNLSPRWRNNGSWLANKSIYNLVRQMATGSGQQSGSFWVDFGGGLPSQLIGYPTYQASDMTASLSAATASNDDVLVLGDFQQYVVADRIGVSLVYEPLVKGSNQRPNGQVGWYATWRVGADTTNADAFRMLRV